MNGDEFTPSEQELIARLRNAPQRRLSTRTVQAIREKVLAEVANPPKSNPSSGSGGVSVAQAQLITGFAIAATIILMSGLLLMSRSQSDDKAVVPKPPTQIAAQNTSMPTETALLPTGTPQPTDTLLPTDTPPPTTTPDATVTTMPASVSVETLQPLMVIEGVVENIDENTITMSGFDIEVTSDHPILTVIDVGDMLRIEGTLTAEDTLVASVINNLLDDAGTDATVGLAGPIEAIEDNIITINGIDLAIDPDDPILKTLEAGDFLSVAGNFELQDAGYLLVAVRVEIITEVGMSISPNCYYEETGMGMGMAMGRWRCDGMGAMGMEAMGMGMGAMGMGN
jgi:hypothetical protein